MSNTSASTDRSIEEMLAMCRFYLEGVALLPVSIIGILGEYLGIKLARSPPFLTF